MASTPQTVINTGPPPSPSHWKKPNDSTGQVASSTVVAPDYCPEETKTDRELQHLLRRRLIVLLSIGLWGMAWYTAVKFLKMLESWDTSDQKLMLGVAVIVLAFGAATLAWLVRRPYISIKRLRVIEVCILAAACVHSIVQTWDPVPPIMFTDDSAQIYGVYSDILLWFVLITIYGVLIPNTFQRSSVVTGVIVVVGVTTMLFAWSRYPLTLIMWVSWLTNLIVFIGMAAGLSVFNSARLDSYRKAAAAARELGQYRLGRKIGGGGMGDVFMAEHRLLKRPCAVKLLRQEKAADETFIRRFEREVQAATRLTHPAAVQVYDYGRENDGTFYYVMEFLPGLTLEEVVRSNGPLPAGRVIDVLRQVCGALTEAHALGLIHRDVKPGNIMLCKLGGRYDAAKLLDFGLVTETNKDDTRITQPGGMMGTPAYMSPEQARGAIDLTPSTDLYSLGLVGYFLLVGHPPFQSDNPLELLHAHLTAIVYPPSSYNPNVPNDLEAIIMRLLAKKPKERYESAADLDSALASCSSAGEWTANDAVDWWERRQK